MKADDLLEKAMFVDMIMDMLIIVDLDGVSENKKTERKMRNDLLNTSSPKLNEYYNSAYDLVQSKYRLENIDRILVEVGKMGADAVKEKYGLV